MTTRKRAKKNIKEDQLVTYAVGLSRWAQDHFNQVIIGVVVLVAVVVALVFTANSRQGSERLSGQQLASAISLYQTNDFAAASASFQQIVERHGGRSAALAHFYKGECQLRQGDYSGAMVEYDAYLAAADKFPMFRQSAIYAKALCYEGLQQPDNAAQTLVDLIGQLDEEDPRYLDALFQAGEFLAQSGKASEAADYFQRVSEKGSGNLKQRATVAAALLGR